MAVHSFASTSRVPTTGRMFHRVHQPVKIGSAHLYGHLYGHPPRVCTGGGRLTPAASSREDSFLSKRFSKCCVIVTVVPVKSIAALRQDGQESCRSQICSYLPGANVAAPQRVLPRLGAKLCAGRSRSSPT